MKCKFHSCTNDVPPNPYRGHERQFCSKQCKSKEGINTLRRKRKQMAVDYLGGKCQTCGFTGNMACFDFHHRDPVTKSFAVNRGMTMKWDTIVTELDKCDLLCANCHRTHHSYSPA